MPTIDRRPLRAVALVLALGCVLALASSYVAADAQVGSGERAANGTANGSIGVEDRINGSTVRTSPVGEAEQVTVVATQGFYVSDERAELVAVDANGDVLYHNATYRVYFDVDPVSGGQYTVEYVAAKHLSGDDCERTDRCTRNVVERVNLSTGNVTRVYARVTDRIYSARWHDTDRVNDTHLVVADIVHDRVYTVDLRTGRITWQWNASEHYPPSAGGKEGDWTHVNDVEPLVDGRVMVSVRNMDEVVFLRPGEGLDDSWTLGEDDAHDTLHEQHNPDYIPPERGGPAIVVADSENNRVVEYQRENGSWDRAWQWRDARLQWPRDADRLPNGNTLLVDSHGDRVVEVTPNGTTAWSATIGMPYDAERLGTGDESTGGPAYGYAVEAARDRSVADRAVLALKSALPSTAVNGLLYAAPSWVRFTDLLVALVLLVDLLAWGVVEWRWSSWSVRGLVAEAR